MLRPAAGSLLAASVLWQVSDPLTALALGVAVGAPTSLVPHAAKSLLRAASTTFTGGLANPFISILEDLMAVALFVLTVLIPVVVAAMLVLIVLLVVRRLAAAHPLRSPPRDAPVARPPRRPLPGRRARPRSPSPRAVPPRPTPPPFTLEVDVDVVSVTAVVHDKAGRFVPGLGPKDVEVYEDGVRQEVSFFREASGAAEREDPPLRGAGPGLQRQHGQEHALPARGRDHLHPQAGGRGLRRSSCSSTRA